MAVKRAQATLEEAERQRMLARERSATRRAVFTPEQPERERKLARERSATRRAALTSEQKVFEALQWLRQNNALYRNVTINQLIIIKLPEDDVPECLWATMEVSTDVEAAENERASYLPDPLTNASEFNNTTAIPIISSAVLDVNSTKVSSDEVAEHLLERIKAQVPEKTHGKDTEQNSKQDTVYIIPRGNKPANEYSNPNLLLEIFPTLFPYECGGLEDGSRPIQINFREHLRYLLSYADRRFEEHYSFIFVVFNILQRRTACFHAQLMTTRSWFQQSAQVLNSLSSEDVAAALINISKAPYSKVTDERINTLMKHIKIIGGHVMGSAHSRSALREIGSTASEVIPPCLPTPNPASEDFDQTFRKDVVQLVETCNIHKHSATCYKYSKGKNDSSKRCRMGMPRALVNVSNIDLTTGQITMRRSHPWINNFNEWFLSACRSNMGIKFIWSGDENAEEDDPEQLLQMLSIVNEITTNTYSALAATQEQRYVHDALQAIDNTDRFTLLNGRTRCPGENKYGIIHDVHTFVVARKHHTTMIKEWKRDIEARRDETRNYLISGEDTLEVRDDETQIEVVGAEIPTSPIKTKATRVLPVTATNLVLFPTKQDIVK
ncbi:unnamed protein product [Rotaria sp. Silwood1]|nr:unnamed protein product [Rotaria sp. Silwood1]CAF1659870.1 unnamed protein product [Rotaria sp. Silwood1]